MNDIERTTGRIGARLYALAAAVVLLTAACGTGTGDEEAAPAVAALSDDGTGEDAENGDAESGESEDGTSNSDDQPKLSPEEAQLAFSQCLEEKGIDNPFAGGDGETIEGDDNSAQSAQIVVESEEEAEELEAAFEECGQIFEDNFGEFELTPEQEAEMADLEAAFNQCMADKGFKISGDAFEVDGDPEDFEAAAAECDKIFEDGGLSLGGGEGEG